LARVWFCVRSGFKKGYGSRRLQVQGSGFKVSPSPFRLRRTGRGWGTDRAVGRVAGFLNWECGIRNAECGIFEGWGAEGVIEDRDTHNCQ
jgi:hypothetical protein